jgi:hypothetical protein
MSYPPPPHELGYSGPPRTNLRSIAIGQKVIVLCILAYVVLVVMQFALPEGDRWVLGIFGLLVILTATVFVFMLAISLFGVAVGILLGILTLMPCIGLISLLIVNHRATRELREHGIHVGLLGARMSDLERAAPR